MRIVPTRICAPGSVLGKTIYTDDGHILLRGGVTLTKAYIDRLYDYGYDYVLIEDSKTDDIIYEDVVSDTTRIQMYKILTKVFRKIADDKDLESFAHEPSLGRSVRDVVSTAVSEIMRYADQETVMAMNMNLLSNFDMERFFVKHSVSVCIYSLLLGVAYGYNRDELTALGIGALLHDIGSMRIQEKRLYAKPHRLTATEFGEIQRHTEIGYRMLKEDLNIPLVSAHCAFQHHERIDGSGYPRGIKGTEIHEFSRWIGIIDVYVALTSARSYRPAISPHHAVEMLYAGAGTLFDKEKVQFFRDKVAIYPVGITVTLNTGQKGVVSRVHSLKHRPVVRVLQNERGEELQVPYEIDLSQNLNMTIEQLDGFTTVG